MKLTTALLTLVLSIFIGNCWSISGQQNNNSSSTHLFSTENISFGGGFGFTFTDQNTQIAIAPNAVYNFNKYISAGPGLIYQYNKFEDFKTSLYGISANAFINPLEIVQLSVELEQLYVQQKAEGFETENFWNTSLFLGIGYRFGAVVGGARINVLYDKNTSVYSQAWLPFIRLILD